MKYKITYLIMILTLCIGNGYSQVGINKTNPEAMLDINGSLRMEHTSQEEGKILRVYENGYAKWDKVFNFNIIMGHMDNLGVPRLSLDNHKTYIKASITLPPGNYLVTTILILSAATEATYHTSSPTNLYSHKTGTIASVYLSDSASDSTISNDYSPNSAKYIAGKLIGPSKFGLIDGSIMINNTSTTNKTYYLWAFKNSNRSDINIPYENIDLLYLGSSQFWGENTLYAIPVTLQD